MINIADVSTGHAAVVEWPTKPSPLRATGALGDDIGPDELPDCDRCPLSAPHLCAGYSPLSPNTAAPPCKIYRSYTDWQTTINVK